MEAKAAMVVVATAAAMAAAMVVVATEVAKVAGCSHSTHRSLASKSRCLVTAEYT